jgi:cytochrome c oxidase cbb3-type subunit 1
MKTRLFSMLTLLSIIPATSFSKQADNMIAAPDGISISWTVLMLLAVAMLICMVYLYNRFMKQVNTYKTWKHQDATQRYASYTKDLTSEQIETLLSRKRNTDTNKSNIAKWAGVFLLLFPTSSLFAQNTQNAAEGLFSQPGIIITLVLLLIPIFLGAALIIMRSMKSVKALSDDEKLQDADAYVKHLMSESEEMTTILQKRKSALDYKLNNTELSGGDMAEDERGIVHNVSNRHEVHFTALKKKAAPRPSLDPDITKLILWYLGCAAFWLALGGAIGEYVGIKFVAPDSDHISWLSFGRLRPVHTNMVFWGWASLGIIGLGYYVVPTVSNARIYNIRWGYISLWLINAMVIIGSLSLMAGVNNGGGEFREYIWPITALFAVALILTLINFFKTVARRTTKEIYISNWYIVSSIIFTIIIALTAYLPFWQNGISETIIQGYYMHSGVGMWFTLFTLGLLYYFIPQQLNKPIYAYSLGILAFWTQILFYTIIGTHHFVFSAIPWWLQTVAIVGSAGMIIPVVAATINFSMTFRGQWHKVASSYTLPFFLVAVVYYFIVSMQGTAEAFRFTNLLWHFTDFTVGHSHLGFYGIITFAIWGGTYAIVPRLTGKEPPQHLVGVHFWLAFVGLLFYVIPLSVGGTLKGMMWMEGKPFIESVVMMFDWWLWRAIGGSLMFISHLVYAWNFYRMTYKAGSEVDVKEETFKQLELLTQHHNA